MFYNVLSVGFLDEIYELTFLALLFVEKKKKEYIFFIVFFLLFVVYSLFYSANPSRMGVLTDAVQQAKPFVFFYYFYHNPLSFTTKQKNFLGKLCVLASVCLLISYFKYGLSGGLISHPFILGISAYCFAILFYFLTETEKKRNYFGILFILGVGILSLRAKFLGECLLFVVCLFFVKKKVKINIKYVMLGILTISLGYFLIAPKFIFYFITSDGAARYLLYRTMPQVLMDYFPFGSGLASFATYASGVYYSPLYHKYGIDSGYGMSAANYSYIADTYFPLLAQFGIVGCALFVFFWIKRYREISVIGCDELKNYKVGLLIIAMVMVESVAGPVFVMSFNFIPMAILGSICCKRKVLFSSCGTCEK